MRQYLPLGILALCLSHAASANNIGENGAWQFQTTADQVNKAYLEDLRQKKKNGYYNAPIYNSTIEHQYNCSITSTALGNQASTTAVANSPSTTGHSSSSTGNASSTSSSAGYGSGESSLDTDQFNTGAVRAATIGDISTSVRGNNYQALNTEQTNSGNQTASVTGSTSCQFGALN